MVKIERARTSGKRKRYGTDTYEHASSNVINRPNLPTRTQNKCETPPHLRQSRSSAWNRATHKRRNFKFVFFFPYDLSTSCELLCCSSEILLSVRVVILYRRFGTAYRSHLPGSDQEITEYGTDKLSRKKSVQDCH